MRCAEKVAATYRVGHRDGYEEGLAAAREAVAALSHGAEKSAWDEYTIGAADGIRDALAAIDALREKQ